MGLVAQLRWTDPHDGGKQSAPGIGRYSTVARFSHETDEQWNRQAWSLVFDLGEIADSNRLQTGSVRFLSEHGPTDWLKPGARFALYEGKRKVAEGVIV